MASGTMPAPTAAAEPLDEPPGVWSRLCGFAVEAGCAYANSVVAVLPTISAPAARSREDDFSVARGAMTFVDPRAVTGRHVCGVDDVLDADGKTEQRTRTGSMGERACLRANLLGIMPSPSFEQGFRGRDTGKAGFDIRHDGTHPVVRVVCRA